MHPGHKLGPNHRTKPEPIMKSRFAPNLIGFLCLVTAFYAK